MVESPAEYACIIQHLAALRIVEPEVPEQTACFQGAPVYVGLFGVHKTWLESHGRRQRADRKPALSLIHI
eukprot:1038746-Prorocentrum_lima.AAC.1